MSSYGSLFVLTDSSFPLKSFCVYLCPYRSFCVLVCPNGTLCVIMGPYGSVLVFMHPNVFLWVLRRFYGS